MSYEGYVERLCVDGHLFTYDVYEGLPENCPTCQKEWAFSHSVDQTNGIEYDDDGKEYPNTVNYPFEVAGYDEHWHVDHHGNKYATKSPRYKVPNDG